MSFKTSYSTFNQSSTAIFTLVFLPFPPPLNICAVYLLPALQSCRLAGPATEMYTDSADCPSHLHVPLKSPSRDISGRTASAAQIFPPLVVCVPSPSSTRSSSSQPPLSLHRLLTQALSHSASHASHAAAAASNPFSSPLSALHSPHTGSLTLRLSRCG